jgi:adenosylcobinamide kinase/adenosylcobinamide-phosphate guanylyltransferase
VLTLVLGGAKSGKSSYAQSLCRGLDKAVFVATAAAEDDTEMEARIARHRAARPGHWQTVEAPLEVVAVVDVLVVAGLPTELKP